MSVELLRIEDNGAATVGAMRVDDEYICLVLEEPWRNNEPNVSCVPTGIYPIVLEYSPSKGKRLWTIKDVPGRSYVRIHIGNSVDDTEGCLLPVSAITRYNGKRYGNRSAEAFNSFMAAMGQREGETILVKGV